MAAATARIFTSASQEDNLGFEEHAKQPMISVAVFQTLKARFYNVNRSAGPWATDADLVCQLAKLW